MNPRTARTALLALALVAASSPAATAIAAREGPFTERTSDSEIVATPQKKARGAASAPPRAERPVVAIQDVRRTRLADVVRITIELENEVPYRSERVPNPDRVFFDFMGTRPAPTLVQGTLSYHDDVVRHVRVGRHPNDVTRVVVDLDGVERYSIFTLYNPYRLVVDCRRKTPVVLPPVQRARVEQDALAALVPEGAEAASVLFSRRLGVTFASLAVGLQSTPMPAQPDDSRPGSDQPAPETRPSAPRPASNPDRPGKPPPTNAPIAPTPLKNGFSLARQLGLGASRVVIDPGHGGRDPGAAGRGVFESAIVLDIAVRLEKLLRAAGIDVVMTRRTNVFVPLEERTAIANRAQGDLFLSIHANASRNTRAQGVESYVLNFASNPEAEAVAARENASSERTMSNLPEIVQAITLNNKLDESREFAASVQQALVKRLRTTHKALRDNGVKQAPFVVLIGAGMPSVLVEISFITHQQEGRLLKTTTYRQKAAEALFDGIRGYQKSLKRAQSISVQ